jgi:radical SAM protein with 4Fe4S-binding SPASM domain
LSILDSFRSRIGNRLGDTQRPAGSNGAEIFHFLRETPEEKTRIHLRIDPDGQGMLMVNASRVYQLNPTAASMARLVLEETHPDQAARTIAGRYRVKPAQARQDYLAYADQLNALLRPDGACPVCDLELETTLPFTARPSAPYRMDLALTYRCNNDCGHCYNARPRSYPELETPDWIRIIDRCWELGIPHIVFTGGEPTLRPDLPELIRHAEKNGQITGINTNGRRLSDSAYVARLVEAGLDHVQVTLESHDPAVHDAMVGSNGAWKQTVAGIRNALDTRLFVMTNTTLLRTNSSRLAESLDFLAELGVPTLGLNALIHSGNGLTTPDGLEEGSLSPLLEIARQKTGSRGQRLIWYTPTEYCHFNPVQMDLGVKGCTAALYNMCVEPDGSVIPCQSFYEPLGKILDNSWDTIWNHPLSLRLRERRGLPERCSACSLLAECGGGCPLSRNTTAC